MSGIEAFVHDAPPWLVGLILLAAMMIMREAGAAAHHRLTQPPRGARGDGTAEGHILTGVLGLLALLIAFTFALALERYENRRELVVTEANALSVTYLRTRLLDDPAPLQGLLKEYARERLVYGERWGRAESRVLQRADALQLQIWAEAMKQVRPLSTSQVPPLVLEPLNQAFDTAAARKAALETRLPLSVLGGLSLYAVLSAGILGYALAAAGGSHRVASFVLFALLTFSIVLIFDLDHPRTGMIRVPQAPMADAVQAMGA
ncbi:hypothetical protein LJR219_003404 [Phenylobacterium sp. LjRoot219]|uniref:bestrophin-like domain n=1 Tax=Phenylobacterium sp. LjRoot219 TaxID=3342283 RepID=UPI003ECF4522